MSVCGGEERDEDIEKDIDIDIDKDIDRQIDIKFKNFIFFKRKHYEHYCSHLSENSHLQFFSDLGEYLPCVLNIYILTLI